MSEILLVNPKKRSARRKTTRRKTVRKKRRTAAQKRATAKMIAANRRRAKGRKPRRKNPVKRRTRPSVRRKRRATPATTRRRTYRRRRKNPAFTMRSIQNQLTEAGIGAVGALGLDVVQGYLPIPANLKAGIVGTGVKALLAIGLGVVASQTRLVRYATAAKMANGALTVVLHDELKKLTAQFAPGIQMGEYMDNGMGYYGSGQYAGVIDDPDAMGSYLPSLATQSMDIQQDGFGAYETDNEYFEDMSYV